MEKQRQRGMGGKDYKGGGGNLSVLTKADLGDGFTNLCIM